MTQHPPSGTVLVLVHGAWHSSAQWAATQRGLAGLGAASVAVDLPGHGLDAPLPSGYLRPGQPGLRDEKSPLADVTMDDCADRVLETLRRVRPYREVVLVAHSAGGGPASLAAERAPELVDRIVYLSAFVPAARPRFVDYLGTPENAAALGDGLHIGDPGELGAIRINPLSPDPGYIEELRADSLAARLSALCHPLPGVNADHATATAFAEAWQRYTGAAPDLAERHRLYRLDTLTPPTPVPEGRARVADERDRAQLIA
ncbi:alpha/beta hydrolase [Streptomyces olivaceus]|uniref:alpha/beta hydrolase n=1 Tax=Streptomyces olivaceus TaxID=47716 RepID=UPI003635C4FE